MTHLSLTVHKRCAECHNHKPPPPPPRPSGASKWHASSGRLRSDSNLLHRSLLIVCHLDARRSHAHLHILLKILIHHLSHVSALLALRSQPQQKQPDMDAQHAVTHAQISSPSQWLQQHGAIRPLLNSARFADRRHSKANAQSCCTHAQKRFSKLMAAAA